MKESFFLLGVSAIFGFCAPSLAIEFVEGENSFTLPMTGPQNDPGKNTGEYYDEKTSRGLRIALESLNKEKIINLKTCRLFFCLNSKEKSGTKIEIIDNIMPKGFTLQDMVDRIEKASSFFDFSDTTKLTLLSGQGLPSRTSFLQFEPTPYGESWRKCSLDKSLRDKNSAKAAFEDLTWVTFPFKEHMKRTYPFLK